MKTKNNQNPKHPVALRKSQSVLTERWGSWKRWGLFLKIGKTHFWAMTKITLHLAVSYYLPLWTRSLLQKSWQLINYHTKERLCYNKTPITPPSQKKKEKRLNEQTVCILCLINSHRNTSPQASALLGLWWALGNNCLLQRKATRPGLLLACPSDTSSKCFSVTFINEGSTSINEGFPLLSRNRRLLGWAVVFKHFRHF